MSTTNQDFVHFKYILIIWRNENGKHVDRISSRSESTYQRNRSFN